MSSGEEMGRKLKADTNHVTIIEIDISTQSSNLIRPSTDQRSDKSFFSCCMHFCVYSTNNKSFSIMWIEDCLLKIEL